MLGTQKALRIERQKKFRNNMFKKKMWWKKTPRTLGGFCFWWLSLRIQVEDLRIATQSRTPLKFTFCTKSAPKEIPNLETMIFSFHSFNFGGVT